MPNDASLMASEEITLEVDADIANWFQARADGGLAVETQINAALRKFVEDEMKLPRCVWWIVARATLMTNPRNSQFDTA